MPPELTSKLKPEKRRRVLLALGWYATELHRGVALYARKAGWAMNIDMERGIELPRNWKGDGIVCVLGMNPAIDEAVEAWRLPTVSIGPFAKAGIPYVMPNNDAIGKLAGEHFLMRGFCNFAFYMPTGSVGEELRMEGFRKHLARADRDLICLRPPSRSEASEADANTADVRWLERELVRLPKPLAVFAEYDDRALEILDACENASISVPEEVAILGADNDELRCAFATVPLSSVDIDQIKQGYEAAHLLDRLMRGEAVNTRTILVEPLGVVTRQSTDILAIGHRNVAHALRIIWEHYTEPLTAEMVAREIPMSSRRLHDAFLKHVGRTMAEELSRRRVEHARRLLEDTKRRKMDEIAHLSGFTSADHMCKLFMRTLKISPSAYRREKNLKLTA